MKADAKGTLSYYLDTPFRSCYPVGKHLTGTVMGQTVANTYTTLSKVSPEMEAATFYGLNQVVAKVQARFSPYETLPPWAETLVQSYARTLASQALRMTHYVILIITRESRHLHNKNGYFSGVNIPPELKTFLKNLPGSSSAAASSFMNSPPNVGMSTYVAAIVNLFNKGSFSGGYGGKPWGMIAQALHSYLDGLTTAEMFVDTAYTLAHNNGPIFNKGMYYNQYGPGLYTILDVQNSGQIAELILEETKSSQSLFAGAMTAQHSLKNLMLTAKKNMPEEIGDFVDWVKVEALGSKHKYPQQKKAQLDAQGKAAAPAIQLFNGVPVQLVAEVQILPTQKYAALKRVKTPPKGKA